MLSEVRLDRRAPRRRHEVCGGVELAREDVLDHAPPKGKDRAGSGGDGVAELVTDAELVRERPEARQRTVDPDLANDRRHLNGECVRFVDPTELGVQRGGDCERAEPVEWLVPRLRVLERLELVAKCSVLIPPGEPECRTYFARHVLERVR